VKGGVVIVFDPVRELAVEGVERGEVEFLDEELICAEPNCDRSFSRIKAVWIPSRKAPVSRIVENFGGGWRAGVGRGYDAKEKADRDRDRLRRRDRNRLSF
jgi:hypothetical protein